MQSLIWKQLAGSMSSSTMQAFRVRVSWSIWTTKRSSAYSRRTSSAWFERRELHCPFCERVRKRSVINVSSLAGLAGYPARTAYSSSKWAIEGFSESLHYELLPFRIQVCVVEPGGYKTEIFESNAQHSRAPSGSVYAPLQAALDKSYQAVSRRDPEDFANVVLGLMRNPAPPFGRARVMMYAEFIACGACYPSQLSVRCSGARRFLISRK